MLFFKKKKKFNEFCDAFDLAELKKLIKRDKQGSVFIPLESGKHALKFCKVNDTAYAPIPTQNGKKPNYYKIINITFVTQFDDMGKKEDTYNIAITYEKNGHNHFYSYDDCDCTIKNKICQQLGSVVNIQIRNKEELRQTQPKHAEKTGATGVESLKTHVEHINTTRREFLTKPIKRINVSKTYSDEERLTILKETARKLWQRNQMHMANIEQKQHQIQQKVQHQPQKQNSFQQTQIKQQNIPIKSVLTRQSTIKEKEKFSPSRYDIQPKRYFQRIKFPNENNKFSKELRNVTKKDLKKLTQEEIDDILFFE